MAVAFRRWFCRGNLVVFLFGTGLFATSNRALGQSISGPYLLRLSHEVTSGTACVLLNSEGKFHYESSDFNSTRVFEGELPVAQLNSFRQNLQVLSHISQSDIEEPIIHGPRDYLDIQLLQDGTGKELLFRSSESQQPFARHLKPLLRWASELGKLPHRELSEDAGQQNCLPRSTITLKQRGEVPPAPLMTRRPAAGSGAGPTHSASLPAVHPLVQFSLLEISSSNAQHRCVLIADDGLYRFEYRLQKNSSKKVEDRAARGQLTAQQMDELREILNAPALARLRHREPPGRAPLNIMGSVLDLLIRRPSGTQQLALTDSRRRSTFFYGGDGDITLAGPLLKFTKEKIEPGATLAKTTHEMNGCSGLP